MGVRLVNWHCCMLVSLALCSLLTVSALSAALPPADCDQTKPETRLSPQPKNAVSIGARAIWLDASRSRCPKISGAEQFKLYFSKLAQLQAIKGKSISGSENFIDQQQHAHCLVADIGGTHARFGIATIQKHQSSNTEITLQHEENYRVQEFASLTAALENFLAKIPQPLRPTEAILAVASAITNDHIGFTNSSWSFSISALKKQLQLTEPQVINDFAAVAWALPSLCKSDVEAIAKSDSHQALKSGVYAALGPGTGIGVAALKIDNAHKTVLETEGGHISFAPRTDDEIKILQFLRKQFDRVSYERLLCGSGLLNLYRAQCDLMNLPALLGTPEAVSSAARQDNAAASAAAKNFCSILGAFAGDTALMFGAWQGVYLSGGLLPHLMDEEGKTFFREAFEDKGRFSSLLITTPTWIIQRGDIGKLGAASLWLGKRTK